MVQTMNYYKPARNVFCKQHFPWICVILLLVSSSYFLIYHYAFVPGGNYYTKSDTKSVFNIFSIKQLDSRETASALLVNTSGCQIIDMNAFDAAANEFWELPDSENCDAPLFVMDDENTLTAVASKADEYETCCYREIKRFQQNPSNYDIAADWETKLSETCIPLNISVPNSDISTEFFQIECQNEQGQKIAKQYHSMVLPPEKHCMETKKKSEVWENFRNDPGNSQLLPPPNVLIFGMDTISRLQSIRLLPLTRELFRSNDFIEMKGYTKIGQNTFPNMMGAMTGLGLNQYESCWRSQEQKIDDCPFIWKNFSKANYMTAFIEDTAAIATFNFLKTGFVVQPVDYYLRTLFTAKYRYVNAGKDFQNSGCFGAQNHTEFLLTYMHNFMKNVATKYPYFFLTWFYSVGNVGTNRLKNADLGFHNILQKVVHDPNYNGNNTIIIFMSDHGYRWGSFRETALGYYEESLPVFFIRIPPMLKLAMPHWYKNVKINSNTLISPLDLHKTLEDILDLASSNYDGENNKDKRETDKNSSSQIYSLFEPIPKDRTCQQAGIAETFCRCDGHFSEVRKSKIFNKLGNFLVDCVNNITEDVVDICTRLTLARIIYIRKTSHVGKDSTDFNDYLVSVETTPGLAHFEAKIRLYNNSTKLILGEINRTNSYDKQADCTSDINLKYYCMCKNALAVRSTVQPN